MIAYYHWFIRFSNSLATVKKNSSARAENGKYFVEVVGHFTHRRDYIILNYIPHIIRYFIYRRRCKVWQLYRNEYYVNRTQVRWIGWSLVQLSSTHYQNNHHIIKYVIYKLTSCGKNGACKLTQIALQKSANPITKSVNHCLLVKFKVGILTCTKSQLIKFN